MVTCLGADELVEPGAVNVVCVGAVALLHLAQIVWRQKEGFSPRQWARRALARAWACVKSCSCAAEASEDADDAQFMREYRSAQLRFVQRATKLVGVFHCIISVAWVAGRRTGAAATRDSRFQMHVWVAYGAVNLLLNAFPSLQRVRGLHVACSFVTLFMCVVILPVDNLHKEDIIVAEGLASMCFILMAPACGKMHSIAGAFVYSVTVVFAYGQAEGVMLRDSVSLAVWHFISHFPLMVMGSWMMNDFMETCIRAAIQSKVSLAESKAVHNLLSLTCDAVVELDKSGKILTEARSLQNLMLRSNSLNGLQLQNCLYADEDRKKLESMLSEDTTTAMVRHVDMVDSIGSQVKVELLGVSFAAGTSKLKYLMGVKEYSDFDSRAQNLPTTSTMPQVALEIPSDTEAPLEAFERATSISSNEASVDSLNDAGRTGWKRTNFKAIDVSLMAVVSMWRCRPPDSGKRCCPLHIACGELKRATKRIGKGRCANVLPDAAFTRQCSACGMIGDFGPDECPVCPQIESLYPPLVELPAASRRERGPREAGPEPSGPENPPHSSTSDQLVAEARERGCGMRHSL